jgi:hypothetical protein
MNICSSCNKQFLNKYNLKRHQDANICTLIRQQKQKQKEEIIFECIHCKKVLCSKQRLSTHAEKCKKKTQLQPVVDVKYKELEEKITEMTKEIDTLKTKPNITINNSKIQNNNYGSILSLTKDMVRETFEKNYTSKDLSGSQKALANFTTKNILNGADTAKPLLYLCKDKTRQKFVFTDDEQIEHEDVNASVLIKIVSKGFHHIKKVYKKETEALQKRIDRLVRIDDTTNLIDAREHMKVLKRNFEDVMNLLENADGYRLQLTKVLPSSAEDRLIIDAKLREFDSTESDSDSDSESDKETEKEEEEDKRRVEVLCTRDQPYPLYDKTIRHIGGLSYGSLRRYKNYFLETGNVKVPERFVGNETLVKRFTDFLHNDE